MHRARETKNESMRRDYMKLRSNRQLAQFDTAFSFPSIKSASPDSETLLIASANSVPRRA